MQIAPEGASSTINSELKILQQYRSARSPPQSTSWNRTTDWTYKKRGAIRKKQNEERYSGFGRGVRVCPCIQFAPNGTMATRENEYCGMKYEEENSMGIEILKTYSILAEIPRLRSGHVAGAKAPATS